MIQTNQIETVMLVGKFSYWRPTLKNIREHFMKTFVFRGTLEIGLLDPRNVFLSFSNPDDCIDILVQGQILFNGKFPMRLFRWTSDFDPRFETSLAPVWVLLPGLKANCFSIPCLRQIVKPIGRSLHVDAATAKFSRPNVAKVKVEVDLLKPLRSKVFIRLDTKKPGKEDDEGVPVSREEIPSTGPLPPRTEAPHVADQEDQFGTLESPLQEIPLALEYPTQSESEVALAQAGASQDGISPQTPHQAAFTPPTTHAGLVIVLQAQVHDQGPLQTP